jgi:Mycothiol maleylpyruvate isomerase N-terminal domain
VPSPYDMALSPYNAVAFIRTAIDFVDLADTEQVRAAWDEPSALEGMSVGAVAVHGLSAIDDILLHCERPEPTTARLLGAVEYYRAARLDRREDLALQGHTFIRNLSEKHAGAGPDAVLTQKRTALKHLKWTLPAQDPGKHVFLPRQPPMAGTLAMMVCNRTIELIAHMDDVAVSVGRPTPPIDSRAAAMALSVLVSLARKINGDLPLILAMTRQERAVFESVRAL